MALSEQDKVDVRRHMGYGAIGTGTTSLMFFKYWPEYTTLEYRLENLEAEELSVIQGQYLPALNAMEMSMYGSADNLDTKKAAVWEWNTNEVADRRDLYNYYRKLLCAFFQLPPGPFFVSSSASGFRFVV